MLRCSLPKATHSPKNPLPVQAPGTHLAGRIFVLWKALAWQSVTFAKVYSLLLNYNFTVGWGGSVSGQIPAASLWDAPYHRFKFSEPDGSFLPA